MSRPMRNSNHRPREMRRRVVLPARLRSSAGRTDTCILNISSRGLLIHSARTGPQGSKVELCRGDLAIVACVVWQDGARAGLRTEDRVPVEDMLSFRGSTALGSVASSSGGEDQRKRNFAAVTIIAVS